MNLKDLMIGFIDADGLVSPHPCLPIDTNASNNGLCYLGEYITLLCLLKQFNRPLDLKLFKPVYVCEVAPGCFNRSPSNKTDYEASDDYVGLLAGIYFTNNSMLGHDILNYGIHNFGFYDNINPSKLKFHWSSFLWRNPALLAMMLWASNKKVWFPLNVITAIIIALSCIGAKIEDGTDSWRLSWLLIQVAKRESLLCNLASKLWYRRLHKVWNSMYNVYSVYYKGISFNNFETSPHPFVSAMRELGE